MVVIISEGVGLGYIEFLQLYIVPNISHHMRHKEITTKKLPLSASM